jgi:uncharacterized protein YcbX
VRVTALSITPVKGLQLQRVNQIDLRQAGAVGDRRFFVVDERDRMINSKVVGELQTVVADLLDGRLVLSFPDGSVVDAPIELGEPLTARFFSHTAEGRVLEGPWAAALSEQVGREVRIVEAVGSVDRGPQGAASLISRASLDRLAGEARVDTVDPRRFRMLIEIDGVDAHAEDAWVGRSTQVGEAVIRWGGHVGRCLITSRDPQTAEIDLPTLDILAAYRGNAQSTEPLPFGIYGAVVSEGPVRVGDEVSLA